MEQNEVFLILATSWFGILVAQVIDRTGKGIRTAPRDTLVAQSSDGKKLGGCSCRPSLRFLWDKINSGAPFLFGAILGIASAIMIKVVLGIQKTGARF